MAIDTASFALAKQRMEQDRQRQLANSVAGLAGMAGYRMGPQYARDQKSRDLALQMEEAKTGQEVGLYDWMKGENEAAMGEEAGAMNAADAAEGRLTSPFNTGAPLPGLPAAPPPMPPPGGLPGGPPIPPAGSLFPGPHPGNAAAPLTPGKVPALKAMAAAPAPAGGGTMRGFLPPKAPSPEAPAPGSGMGRSPEDVTRKRLRRARMGAVWKGDPMSAANLDLKDLDLSQREDPAAVLADQEFIALNLGKPEVLQSYQPKTRAGRAAKVEALAAASGRGIEEEGRKRERDEKREDRTGIEKFQKAMQDEEFKFRQGQTDAERKAAKEKSDLLKDDFRSLSRFRVMTPADLTEAATLPPEQGGPDFKTAEGWEAFLKTIGWQEARVDEFLERLGVAKDPETGALLPVSRGTSGKGTDKPAVTLDQFIENEKSVLKSKEEELRREVEKMEDKYRPGKAAYGVDEGAFQRKKTDWEAANRGLGTYDLDAAQRRWEAKFGGGTRREVPGGLLQRRPARGPELAPEGGGDESAFRRWYGERAKRLGLDADPDNPEHRYDYRAAFRAGAEPDETGHWPSQFKADDHPNRFIDGVDTKTGKPGRSTPAAPPRPSAPHPAERDPRAVRIRNDFKDGKIDKAEAERRLDALAATPAPSAGTPAAPPGGDAPPAAEAPEKPARRPLPPPAEMRGIRGMIPGMEEPRDPGASMVDGFPALQKWQAGNQTVRVLAPGLRTPDYTKPVTFPMGIVGQKGDPEAEFYRYKDGNLYRNPAYRGGK